jgi:hypothetical protein
MTTIISRATSYVAPLAKDFSKNLNKRLTYNIRETLSLNLSPNHIDRNLSYISLDLFRNKGLPSSETVYSLLINTVKTIALRKLLPKSPNTYTLTLTEIPTIYKHKQPVFLLNRIFNSLLQPLYPLPKNLTSYSFKVLEFSKENYELNRLQYLFNLSYFTENKEITELATQALTSLMTVGFECYKLKCALETGRGSKAEIITKYAAKTILVLGQEHLSKRITAALLQRKIKDISNKEMLDHISLSGVPILVLNVALNTIFDHARKASGLEEYLG